MSSAIQVSLALQLAKCFASPGNAPVFVKKRRGTSRPLGISDFQRNVESDAERSLFLECHSLHTKGRHTDWTSMTREFNLRVTRVWEASGSLSDLYLKSEQQLRAHEKVLVKQITEAEARRISAAVAGLQGLAAAPAAAPVPVQLAQPSLGQGLIRGQGTGRGGKNTPKRCKGCSGVAGHDMYKAGHNCALYLISMGKDPRQYNCAKEPLRQLLAKRGAIPSQEEAARMYRKRKEMG